MARSPLTAFHRLHRLVRIHRPRTRIVSSAHGDCLRVPVRTMPSVGSEPRTKIVLGMLIHSNLCNLWKGFSKTFTDWNRYGVAHTARAKCPRVYARPVS